MVDLINLSYFPPQIKLRSQIATEQEKLLTEKEQELERIRQDLASTKDDLSQKSEEVNDRKRFFHRIRLVLSMFAWH